jgi:hypothetical protein
MEPQARPHPFPSPPGEGDKRGRDGTLLKQGVNERGKECRLIDELVELFRGGGLFKGQSDEWCDSYVRFHVGWGTLAWVGGRSAECGVRSEEWNGANANNAECGMRSAEWRILGVGVIWPVAEDFARFCADESPIVSGYPDWSADSIYVAQVAAVMDGRGVMAACVRAWCDRFPEAGRKKWLAHRDGKLVRLDGGRYERWVGQVRTAECGVRNCRKTD